MRRPVTPLDILRTVNLIHRWYCKSDGWAKIVQEYMLPNALKDVEVGDNVLEIGPGPGRTTEWLKDRVPALTAIEIDHKLAESLRERMAGANVTVTEGDATKMPFPDASFTAALSFTMLHHVPSLELQNRLLAEACRVLKPGGLFIGSDSRTSLRFRVFHVFDTCVPVDPATFSERLAAAGFADPYVGGNAYSLWFRARKR
jgi:ubiquinone/menaquinone biosynthesis C-methylase UbiE